MKTIFTFLTLFAFLNTFSCYEPEVSCKLGTFRGLTENVDGHQVNVFLGIPYAEPPIGDMRYRKPRPLKTRKNDVFAAQSWPNVCLQMIPPRLQRSFLGVQSEDCLYLNVWTPVDLKSDFSQNLKPVMVWVHGGAFVFGGSSRDMYNSSLLSSFGDMVVVTINYRLGALGLLYTDNEEIPGNMGLYDQALALEWINENIAYFGGDKDAVTLVGLSAGAMSVSVHLTSPISHSFYKNAIIASGVSIDHFILESKENAIKKSIIFAKLVGCDVNEENSETLFSKSTVECLRKVEAKKIIQAQFNVEIAEAVKSMVMIPFFPIFGDQFVPKLSQKMWKEKLFKPDSSLLIGTLPNDGISLMILKSPLLSYEGKLRDVVNNIFTNFVPKETSFVPEDIINVYASGIREDDTSENKKALYTLMTDFFFNCPTLVFAEQYSKVNPVYQYVFEYEPKSKRNDKICDVVKPCHAHDEPFIFGTVGDVDDKEISFKWMKIISQFVRTGAVEWPSHTKTKGNVSIPFYYRFKGENSSDVEVGYKHSVCKLWNNMLFSQI